MFMIFYSKSTKNKKIGSNLIYNVEVTHYFAYTDFLSKKFYFYNQSCYYKEIRKETDIV